MILGIGCDIVKNSRFNTIEESVLRRIFSKEELKEAEHLNKDKRLEFFASRFATRESISKATRIPIFELNGDALVIKKYDDGAPFVELSKAISDRILKKYDIDDFTLHITLSHESDFSVSYAILESL